MKEGESHPIQKETANPPETLCKVSEEIVADSEEALSSGKTLASQRTASTSDRLDCERSLIQEIRNLRSELLTAQASSFARIQRVENYLFYDELGEA